MRSSIFIPKKLNIGFQNRKDTYTKKLAYIIYFDEKDVLRKENSWNNWRDKTIDNVIHDNIPTSGFVLNKKTGDYGGWNHRQAYVRVYDPRDFEFEITVENLLYILENTNSIKGKGLEGEFIYGWDGTELVLIPVSSPDYKEILQYNEIVHENKQIKAKDLVVGATYRTKQNEDYMYMGKFDRWDIEREFYNYTSKDVNKGKHHWFVRKVENSNSVYLSKIILKSLGNRFINEIQSKDLKVYDELFNLLEHDNLYSPLDKSKDKYIKYTLEEFIEKANNINWQFNYYDPHRNKINMRKTREDSWELWNDNLYNKNSKIMNNIEDIYNITKPHYKNEYLANGKLYKEGK